MIKHRTNTTLTSPVSCEVKRLFLPMKSGGVKRAGMSASVSCWKKLSDNKVKQQSCYKNNVHLSDIDCLGAEIHFAADCVYSAAQPLIT